MAYDNSGSISKNTRKEKETHPDIKGKGTIDGVEYWIDGWQKDGENGKWYSLAFKRKDGTKSEVKRQDAQRQPDDDGSSIPF